MDERSPIKKNTVFFEEQMTAALSVTETDTLVQRMDGFNQSSEINRLSLQSSEKVPDFRSTQTLFEVALFFTDSYLTFTVDFKFN